MIAKTKNTSSILFLLIFLGVAFPLFAQKNECNCFIHGEVVDKQTKQPIVGAVVRLKETNKGTTTDEKGHYHIDKLCHQQYTVVCRIVGYQETFFKIDLNHAEKHEQDFSLKEDELHLDHVEIKAQKVENLTQNLSTISDENLSQTRGQTLGETLKQVTGVTTLQTGSSIAKPVIHGMHSNRVLIMNNGIRQEGQQWGSEHAPEIDPFVAKKISVLKGAAGVRYGSDAIAGVVMLEPEPLPDSVKLKGEINSVYFSNGNQGVISTILEKGIGITRQRGNEAKRQQLIGIRVQGTIKRGGDISTPSYRLINTGVSEINFSIGAGHKFKNFENEVFFSQFNTKIGVFAGSHIGNVVDLIAAIKRGNPLEIYTPEQFSYSIDRPYQDLQHNLLKLKSTYRTSNGNTVTLTLGRQYNFRREVDVLRGDKNLVQRFMLTTYTSELVYEHKPIFKLLTGSVGLSNNYQENITSGTLSKPTSSTVLIPNFQNFTSGIFLIERIVKEKWEMEGGMRFDYRNLDVSRIPRGTQQIVQNNQQNTNFTGTFGVNLRPTNQWNLSVNVTSALRPPTVNELYSDGVHHGAASFEKGNDKLVPEKAINTSFTSNYISKTLQFEAHFYWNYIRDFLFLSPTGRTALTIRGAFPEFYYTQTNAQFRGFDFSSNVSIYKNFSWQNKSSFLQADDITNAQPLIMIPANRIENSLKFEMKRTTLSFTNLYVFKQNRVPNKLIFNDISKVEIVFSDFGGDFAPPPPAYSLWSISAGQHFNFKNNKSLFLNGSIQNLFNTKYRDYLNRFRYFTDEMGRNMVIRARYVF